MDAINQPLAFGDRVTAKYRGSGTIVAPSWEMQQRPHFDDDFCVQWDAGGIDWHGENVLRRSTSR